MRRKGICLFLILFIALSILQEPLALSADDIYLPLPGVMVSLSSPLAPTVLKGVTINPNDPFAIDFILSPSDKLSQHLSTHHTLLEQESRRLIKYFLASLTVPGKDWWVNLSPYENQRIITDSFGQTAMGQDLLAQDYLLKQITASLMYPEGEVGKYFWKRIYEAFQKHYGTTQIPINSFNKVWIVPGEAEVYEHDNTAFIVKSHLKVLVEGDYLSSKKNGVQKSVGEEKQAFAESLVREIIVPLLEKEVNEGENFASLRQVYHALILGIWFKKKMKGHLFDQQFVDQNKVQQLLIHHQQSTDPASIYERYLLAFKKGVYHYIKEEVDPVTSKRVARTYFSGGFSFDQAMVRTKITRLTSVLKQSLLVGLITVTCQLNPLYAKEDVQESLPSDQMKTVRLVDQDEFQLLMGKYKSRILKVNGDSFNRNKKIFDNLPIAKRNFLKQEFSQLNKEIIDDIEGTLNYVANASLDQLRNDIQVSRQFFANIGSYRLTKDSIDKIKKMSLLLGDKYIDELTQKYPLLFDVEGNLAGKNIGQIKQLLLNLPKLSGKNTPDQLELLRVYHLAIACFYANNFHINEMNFRDVLAKSIINPTISDDWGGNSDFEYGKDVFSQRRGIPESVLAHEIAHQILFWGSVANTPEIISEFVADMLALSFTNDVYGQSYSENYVNLIMGLIFVDQPQRAGDRFMKMNNPWLISQINLGKRRYMDGHFWARSIAIDMIRRYQSNVGFNKIANAIVVLDRDIKENIDKVDDLVRFDEAKKELDLFGYFLSLVDLIEGKEYLVKQVVEVDINGKLVKKGVVKPLEQIQLRLIIPEIKSSKPRNVDVKSDPKVNEKGQVFNSLGNQTPGGVDFSEDRLKIAVTDEKKLNYFQGTRVKGRVLEGLMIKSIHVNGVIQLNEMFKLLAVKSGI